MGRPLQLVAMAIMSASVCSAHVRDAYAYTECERHVKEVWNNAQNGSTEGVWVGFKYAAPIFKSTNSIGEAQLERFYSMAMTALVPGKKLVVRYPESGLDCASQPTVARSGFLGTWLRE